MISVLPQGILLTGPLLESLTCEEGGASDITNILLVPEKQQPTLEAYRGVLCSGVKSQRAERFRQLSLKLREQIDTRRVMEQVQESGVTLVLHVQYQYFMISQFCILTSTGSMVFSGCLFVP